MPTGINASLLSGGSFERYVWTCARQFGPLVHLRDEPGNDHSLIKPEIKPDPWRAERLKEDRDNLERLKKLTEKEHLASCQVQYDTAIQTWEASELKREEERRRVDLIHEMAQLWEPPTEDHENLKKYMLSQIEMLYEHDLKPRDRPVKELYFPTLEEVIWATEEALARTQERWEDAVKNAESRTKWISALWDQIGPPPEK